MRFAIVARGILYRYSTSLLVGNYIVSIICYILCAVDWSTLVSAASVVLCDGGIIAVPTDTIYGIASLAQNSAAIGRLYEVKGRRCSKPLAISVSSVNDVYQ